ncbi:MAG: hypothetical protein FJ216_09805, partial [Ignavibacteria bacterium]|nr:hypothetical protein [Ignavibacteria bacterium]
KLKGYERKYILRNTIGKALPSEILKAHKKGFGIPLREWFKSVEFQDKLEKLHTEDFGLNKTEIKKIIEINRNGEYDFGNFIWMLFVLKKIILN